MHHLTARQTIPSIKSNWRRYRLHLRNKIVLDMPSVFCFWYLFKYHQRITKVCRICVGLSYPCSRQSWSLHQKHLWDPESTLSYYVHIRLSDDHLLILSRAFHICFEPPFLGIFLGCCSSYWGLLAPFQLFQFLLVIPQIALGKKLRVVSNLFLEYFRKKHCLIIWGLYEKCSVNWIFNPTLVPTKITGVLGWCSLIWKLPKCWKSPNTLKKVEEILTSFSHFASTFLKLSGATTEKQARKTSWIYDFVPLFTLDLFLTVSG